MSWSKQVLVGFLLCAAPIGGIGADDREGPFVAVDLNFVQPTGLESGYTIVDADDDFEPEGPIYGPEISKEFSPEIHIGYAFDGGRGFAASYWSFDELGTDRRESPVGGSVWDSLFAPEYALGILEGTASADITVEAERLDLVYYWSLRKGDRVELDWKAGIRHARFERVLNARYDDAFDPELVAQASEAEGIGVVAGVESRMRLSGNWSLVGGASLGFLSGDVESSNRHTFGSLPDDPILDVRREEDRSFNTIDLEVGLVWHADDRFDVALGYRFETWNGVLTRDSFADDFNTGFLQSDSADVSWDGVSLGLGFSF